MCASQNIVVGEEIDGRRQTAEGRGTGEAYIVLSLVVGSFVQEHLHNFHMTLHSGEDQSSPTVLSETDTHSERETSR